MTHRLDEVFRIADRVTVLRDGRRVSTAAIADTTPAALVHDIVGRSLSELFIKPPAKALEQACSRSTIWSRAMSVRSPSTSQQGEIVGLVGLRGAGHRTCRPGDIRRCRDRLRLDIARWRAAWDPVRRAMPSGDRIGFVSSKRGEESLAPSMTVRENLFINPVTNGIRAVAADQPGGRTGALPSAYSRDFRCGRAIPKESSPRCRAAISRRSSSRDGWRRAAGSWCSRNRPIGVDVGSKAEIYQLLEEALDQGLAVLLISSDFEEVAGICHRALIFDRGRVTAELRAQRAFAGAVDGLGLGRRREQDQGEASMTATTTGRAIFEPAPRASSPCGTWRSFSSC